MRIRDVDVLSCHVSWVEMLIGWLWLRLFHQKLEIADTLMLVVLSFLGFQDSSLIFVGLLNDLNTYMHFK